MINENNEKDFYDLEGQEERLKVVSKKVFDYTFDYFDENSNWIKPEMWENSEPGLRERLFFSMAYFQSGEESAIKLANIIIKSSKYYPCTFSPMLSIQLLKKYDVFLEGDTKKVLMDYLIKIIDWFKDYSFNFVGVNDNFPCMGTYTVLIAAELLKRQDLHDIGVKRLKYYSELLTRRGTSSEFNSPTYTPIHAFAMAELANTIKDPKLKKLALECEERTWADILGHYHPSTYQSAGPFSRAYTVDSTSNTHQSSFILYALLGDKLIVNPLNTLFLTKYAQEEEVIHNSIPFMQVSTAWLMNTTYHCPIYLANMALNKKYPFIFKATTEYSSSTDALPSKDERELYERDTFKDDETYEYGAGSGNIYTYMTEDYALGTSSNEFHNGTQTDSFHLLYRRNNPVKVQKDISSIYCRYLFNKHEPGQSNDYSVFNTSSSKYSTWDEGRKLGIQYRNTSMILYKPKIYGNNSVTNLRLSIILPSQHKEVDEIWLGNKKIENNRGESIDVCPIFIKDGLTYTAFIPLILTNLGRECAIKVKRINDYLTISLYNYEGIKKNFSKRGLLLIGNGFVCEVRSEDEVGCFEEFRKTFRDVKINDGLFDCEHSRQTYLRHTKYEREGLKLECEYSPVSEGVKFVAINGLIPENKKLYISGFDVNRLPFM